MRLLIYSQSEVIHTDSTVSSDVAGMFLLTGHYKILSFNNSTKNIRFSGLDHFHTAQASVQTVLRSSEPVIEQPDMLYIASLNDLLINADQSLEQALEIFRLVKPIRLIIQTDQMDDIASCNGSLSGISSSINLSTRVPSTQNPGTVLFEAQHTNDLDFTSVIQVFGTAAGKDSTGSTISNSLVLFFTMTDGTQEQVSIDISNILQYIDDDGITIALVITSRQGAGLTGIVANWQDGVGTGDAD